MRILEFGNIPSHAGGKANDGANNVIYSLAEALSALVGLNKIYLAATDFFKMKEKRENLTIIGWTKSILFKFILFHPILFLKALVMSSYSFFQYRYYDSFLKILFRNIFLTYSIYKIKPDIIHLHGIRAAIYMKLIPSKINIIITMHGLFGNDNNVNNQSVVAKMEKEICSQTRSRCIVFVSNRILKAFKEQYGTILSSHYVILNAYDTKSFFYIPRISDDKLTLVTIASISKRKGQKRVLEALKSCNKMIRYICIGSNLSGEANDLMDYAMQNNIDFEYFGTKKPSEIREILAQCDFMILASSSEGFPLVFLESIASGVPVIYSKELSLSNEGDLLNNSNSILLDNTKVNSIVKVISSLDKDEFNRKLIAEKIKKQNWSSIAELYNDLFTKHSF